MYALAKSPQWNAISQLLVVGALLIGYFVMLIAGIRFANENFAFAIGLVWFFLPLVAVGIAINSKLHVAVKILVCGGFLSIGLIVVLTELFCSHGSLVASVKVDERNCVAVYRSPNLCLAGQPEPTNNTVWVMQQHSLFPGVVKEYVLASQSPRSEAQIDVVDSSRISCLFPANYRTNASPDESAPLRLFLKLKD